MIRAALLSLLILPVVSCASSVSSSGAGEGIFESTLLTLPAEGLGPQTLATGDCGLWLWSQTDVDKLIFFSLGQSGRAKLRLAGSTQELQQESATGEIFGQFLTNTVYADQLGGRVNVSLAPGEELIDGQRISSGLITWTDSEGWQIKAPVLGVRACQVR
jgi:hypothetical protein